MKVEPISPPEIVLTELENQICGLLDEFTLKLKDDGTTTSCRIAGGWVRDKLLGSQSNDIDIALSDMMGFAFAEKFAGYVQDKGLHANKPVKILSNPDQSKHLETSTANVLGIDIDFVNLRSEEYAEGSRIPTQVRFGTPLEDALRRDLTVNTLFYNVHTRSVEDHTEKGLKDLRSGLIRTPLPSLETFRDDPLRILRCIRFASRFGWDIDEEILKAARDPHIQEALTLKISRERVGEELDKMMKGRDPLLSIELIEKFGLYNHIFAVTHETKENSSAPIGSTNATIAAGRILHLLTNDHVPTNQGNLIPSIHPILLQTLSKLDLARLYLAALLVPFDRITYQDRKKKIHPLVEAAIRDGIKIGTQNHYLDGIPSLFAAAKLLKASTFTNIQGECERASIGLILRNRTVHSPDTGSHWAISMLFSLVLELVPMYDVELDNLNESDAMKCINTYNAFLSRIDELNLAKVVELKPLLDGREVVQLLESAKPGPWTGQVLEQVMEWQLNNPEATKDDCKTWLRSEHEKGNVVTSNLSEPRERLKKKPRAS